MTVAFLMLSLASASNVWMFKRKLSVLSHPPSHLLSPYLVKVW